MNEFLGKIKPILEWIGDEPFRLFAVLALITFFVVFALFRSESPRYKVFASVTFIVILGAVGYELAGASMSKEADASNFFNPEWRAVTEIVNENCEYSIESGNAALDLLSYDSNPQDPTELVAMFNSITHTKNNVKIGAVTVDEYGYFFDIGIAPSDVFSTNYAPSSPGGVISISCEPNTKCVFSGGKKFDKVTLFIRNSHCAQVAGKLLSDVSDSDFDLTFFSSFLGGGN